MRRIVRKGNMMTSMSAPSPDGIKRQKNKRSFFGRLPILDTSRRGDRK